MGENDKKPVIVWFRQDLRLQDNPALSAAAGREGAILPVYIFDDENESDWAPGGASRWWLHHALEDLERSFAKRGLALVIRKGDSEEEIKDILDQTGASCVYWNRRYEPNAIRRDKSIKKNLKNNGLDVASFNASLLFEPHEISNQQGEPYKVFTPYWKYCLSKEMPDPTRIRCTRLEGRRFRGKIDSLQLQDLKLLPKTGWDERFYDEWKPTQAGALERLGKFLSDEVEDYKKDRDRPGIDGTSKLSPYLHFGQIGPRYVAYRIRKMEIGDRVGPKTFMSEIGWREFSYHLLYHFPKTPEEPLREEFKDFPWKRDQQILEAWQQGRTGYPIVDAGMRQLWAIGWMHNRVRMIVASLLVKHLLHRWQDGAKWFWETLVDADLANNTQGWQWTAGCGADAAPYFRVFNPILQGERYDPEGKYIRKWVPELKNVPDKWIHKPWEGEKSETGIELERDYPYPIVSHFAGRNRALEAYERIKKS